MRLGFDSATLPDYTLEQVFRFAHDSGFSGVALKGKGRKGGQTWERGVWENGVRPKGVHLGLNRTALDDTTLDMLNI